MNHTKFVDFYNLRSRYIHDYGKVSLMQLISVKT